MMATARVRIYPAVIAMAVLAALALTSRTNFLLFHCLVELFSINVAVGIFMVAWNSRRFIDNNYLLFIGISFLFVSFLDLLHTLAYPGMSVFSGAGENLATQLWIAARLLGSASLVLAPLTFDRTLKAGKLLAVYAAITALPVFSIFLWKIFPACIAEGRVTAFKAGSEYVVFLLFAAALFLLIAKKEEFDRSVLVLLVLSVVFRMAAELSMSASEGSDGLAATAGHLLKIISFYLVYKALIETGLVKPYNLLFRNLKKSEEAFRIERDRVQHYLDVAGVMLVIINADQTVGMINRKGREVLGLGEQEIVGKNWFTVFVPERFRDTVREEFVKLVAREVVPLDSFEHPVLVRGGGERLIAWHNVLLTDDAGTVLSTLSSGEDITERRLTEDQLARKTKELERSNAELDQFAAVVSHDLKDPLATIGGFAQLLREKYWDRLDARGQRMVESIVGGALRMEAMIGNLLSLARVSTGARPFRPVESTLVIAVVMANLRKAIEESGAVITADELPRVTADKAQLTQLFQNLITNAIKYRGDAPPRIHVSAKPLDSSAGHSAFGAPQPKPAAGWVFSITDNGIGIEPSHARRIFQIFQRLHHDARYPGTGIGLAVCKKIVERHGGRIWVESEPGKGATFYFTLS